MARFSSAKNLVKLSHKFFAHASDVASREGIEYKGILLNDIENVHRAIVSVECAITDDILFMGIARDVVAMPPLGFLAGLDRVYVPTDAIAEMDMHWAELVENRNAWKNWYEGELYRSEALAFLDRRGR